MRRINFTKKMKNPFLLVDAVNSKKIRQNLLAYFFIKKMGSKTRYFFVSIF
jgi:hypothetical protein